MNELERLREFLAAKKNEAADMEENLKDLELEYESLIFQIDEIETEISEVIENTFNETFAPKPVGIDAFGEVL